VTNLSDRDRKIMLGVIPLLVVVAYWFLLLAPKREEAATASKTLTEQQQRRDTARQLASQATVDKTDFAADYGEIVRLGKAIPARVDMPSLLVQLDRAAEGTGISFTKISTGDRTTSIAPAQGATAAPATPAGTTAPPTAAGGEAAQSAPGTATEAANGAAATSDQANAAAQQSGVAPSDTATSTTTGEGGLAVGGGAPGTAAVDGGVATQPSLETVPLELEFVGNFFNLADFFHDIKRFVHVANENVVVNGRLVTIEGVNFSSDPTIFPKVKASLNATVYLSPLTEGATAGATPAGPAVTTPAAAPEGTTTPAPTPTAVATPR
jgi:Tfp pilus assembly protein PilO